MVLISDFRSVGDYCSLVLRSVLFVVLRSRLHVLETKILNESERRSLIGKVGATRKTEEEELLHSRGPLRPKGNSKTF